MDAPTELRYEEHDGVGVITLDRPHARNALTFTTDAELEAAVRDTTTRCLVVTGSDPAFCSGDDVKQIMAGAGEAVASGLHSEPRLTPAAEAMVHTNVPIIAAVTASLADLFRTADHREGVAAFLEKRPPKFVGH